MRQNPLSSVLSTVVKRGSIGPVWFEGREFIRRLFVTVRDEQWQEVAPKEWTSDIDEPSATVSISARHVSEVVDFAWQGTLEIADGGRELTFEFTGKVLRDMKLCRLGLVILHPVEWMAGAEICAENSNSVQSLRVPNLISPQPIVDGIPAAMTQPFSTLRVERSGLGKLEFRFEGDLFELEDQRNWGDSTFKTYCTPLRLGFPRFVESGTSISHRVRATVSPSRTCDSPPSSHLRKAIPQSQSAFPKIGRVRRSADTRGDEEGPSWRHFQVRIGDDGDLAELIRPLAQIPSSARLEIALVPQWDPRPLRSIVSRLSEHHHRIERLLVYGARSPIPIATVLERLRIAMDEFRALCDVPVLSATQGYFVEFNRAEKFIAPMSGIAFPLTATVHADDADTVVDNVVTIRDMADTARGLLRDPQIAFVPLALYHPRPQALRKFPTHLAKPWLVASIIEAALSGVTSITLDDDAVKEMSLYPANGIELSLSSLIECSDMQATAIDSNLPVGVHAVMLNSAEDGAKRLLASNLSSCSQLLAISGSKIELPAYSTLLRAQHD